MKLIILSSLFVLVSCTSYPKPLTTTAIAPGAEFTFVDSTNIEAFTALQKVTVTWEEHKLTFNVQLENADGAFHLVGLTPVFSRSFLISYSKGILDFKEHPYFKYPVKPENMLADFQMAFADSQYLVSNQLKVKISDQKREFFSGNDLIQSITYSKQNRWESEVNIVNHKNDYRIKIETLQFESL